MLEEVKKGVGHDNSSPVVMPTSSLVYNCYEHLIQSDSWWEPIFCLRPSTHKIIRGSYKISFKIAFHVWSSRSSTAVTTCTASSSGTDCPVIAMQAAEEIHGCLFPPCACIYLSIIIHVNLCCFEKSSDLLNSEPEVPHPCS